MNQRLPVLVPILIIGTMLFSAQLPATALAQHELLGENLPLALDEDPIPDINIWYGDSGQEFGNLGNPQPQVNILGNVTELDKLEAEDELTFTINGGATRHPLSLGPDTRRLVYPGDFNVEIFDGELNEGLNTIEIHAKNVLTDTLNVYTSTQTVTFNYHRSNIWPLPYDLSWDTVSDIQDGLQILDGEWEYSADGIRTMSLGYDRLLNLGDLAWKDYEVLVPITVHGTGGPGIYTDPSYSPGVGIILRWNGNSDDPVANWQPSSGWLPLGAIGWYRWYSNPSASPPGRLLISGNNATNSTLAEEPGPRPLSFGVPYWFKFRVESVPQEGPRYSLKVWQDGNSEPTSWDLTAQGEPADPRSGSVVLMAHHVDATFGDVQVTPLGGAPEASTIKSTDFNTCSLDTNLWTFIDPVGDSTITMAGTLTDNAWVTINVPAGSSHNLTATENKAARIMQQANNTDFTIETKFESPVRFKYQMQGVAIHEDQDSYLRFGLYSDNVDTRVYTASYSDGDTVVYKSAPIAAWGAAPLYLRIQREGDRWIEYFSTNGTEWESVVTFSHPIDVNSVGPYAGNFNSTPSAIPAHTAIIDYFYNSASPIAAEDSLRAFPVDVTTAGNGTVSYTPLKNGYLCSEQVTFQATPATGWMFYDWSGDVVSMQNPLVVSIQGPLKIKATFVEEGYLGRRTYLPLTVYDK